jgi:hypothetical protein
VDVAAAADVAVGGAAADTDAAVAGFENSLPRYCADASVTWLLLLFEKNN